MSTKSSATLDTPTSKEGIADREKLESIEEKKRDERTGEQFLKNKTHELKNKAEEQRQKLREEFANWAKRLTTGWIIFISSLLVIVGWFNSSDSGIELYPKEVLITLLATTTINVVALTLIIIKGLFANEKNSLAQVYPKPAEIGLKSAFFVHFLHIGDFYLTDIQSFLNHGHRSVVP